MDSGIILWCAKCYLSPLPTDSPYSFFLLWSWCWNRISVCRQSSFTCQKSGYLSTSAFEIAWELHGVSYHAFISLDSESERLKLLTRMNLKKLTEGASLFLASHCHSLQSSYFLDFRRASYLSFVTLRVTSCGNHTGTPQNKFCSLWAKGNPEFLCTVFCSL